MDDWALVNGVVRVDYLRCREVKKGIDGDEDNADGIFVNRASPLKVVVSSQQEWGSDVSF